jgi:hypothetical protein
VTYSITASGNRQQVLDQLEAAREVRDSSDPRADETKSKVIELLHALISGDDVAPAGAGYDHHYYINVNGHSGGSFGSSLTVQVNPHYVAKAKTKTSKE